IHACVYVCSLWHVNAFSSSPPCPINATFTSVNLRNVLQWFPGNGTPEDTHFTVQYAIYGDSVANTKGTQVHWRKVQQCTKIVQTWCDLSNELWDLEQGYYARVRAVSRRSSSIWTLTRRFDPKSDTSFGPPLVSIEIENNSAIITLKGPMRYLPNNHTSVVSMATLYPHMMYNLSIHNTYRDRKNHVMLFSGLYKYRLMEYNTEHCFSGKAKFLAMPIQCHSSEWHCITTPPDPVIGQLQRVVVGIAVPSVCLFLLVVTCYFLYHYLMGKGQKSPYTLVIYDNHTASLLMPHFLIFQNPPSFNHTVLTFPLEKLNIIHVTAIEPIFPRQHMADLPPGYAIQRSGSAPDPEQPHDERYIDYGFVALAPKIDVREDEEREMRADGTNHKGEHKGEHKSTNKRDDHLSRVNRSQAKPHLSQSSTQTCLQEHKPADIGTSMRAKPLAQTPGATNREADTEEGDKEFLGSLIINKTPQTGVGEGSERESVPLLSAYVSQDVKATSDADESDYLADKYCSPRPAVMKEDHVEQEEGGIFLHWEPSAWNLQSLGSEEEVNVTRGRVLLQDVLIRQTSEEEAEAQRQLERDGEREWDNILSKWNLVIPMDE
uniref:Interleukin 20 receptor, alpha n=1 Tax=Mola mola TaxID=94237 RepID=A0A3Q3X3Y4_MOLML